MLFVSFVLIVHKNKKLHTNILLSFPDVPKNNVLRPFLTW